jgi:hypothetical protein
MVYTREYSAMLHPVNYKKYELPIFGILFCAAARV